MRAGSKIHRAKGFIRHYAVYLGLCEHGVAWVIHNSFDDGHVCITTYEQFRDGQEVWIEREPAPGTEDEIVRRARALCGQRYDLIGFNCESFANLATEGRAYSTQIAAVFGIGLGLALLGAATYAARRPEYDPLVDRYRDDRGRFVSW